MQIYKSLMPRDCRQSLCTRGTVLLKENVGDTDFSIRFRTTVCRDSLPHSPSPYDTDTSLRPGVRTCIITQLLTPWKENLHSFQHRNATQICNENTVVLTKIPSASVSFPLLQAWFELHQQKQSYDTQKPKNTSRLIQGSCPPCRFCLYTLTIPK